MQKETSAYTLKSLGVVMKAKVYFKGRVKNGEERWTVQLYWKGKQYRRQMWDDEVPLKARELADILANSINTDIKVKGRYFDPRVWFAPERSELRFERYAWKWLGQQEHLTSYPDIESYFRRWVIPFFGKEDIRDVRKGHIKDFLRRIEGSYSAKTCKNILGHLSKLFRDALDDELILRVPAMPGIAVPESELRYITQEQVYQVINNIPERDQAIFRFGYFYGLRPGEVRALQWDMIDYEKKIVTIKRTFSQNKLQEFTKSKRIRHLPLLTDTISLLNTVGRGISGFVFRTRYGKPYRKQRLSELWRSAAGRTGTHSVPLYNAMRHSRAMHLLNVEGWDFADVQRLLGHTTAQMTKRYAEMTVEGLRKRYGGNNKSSKRILPES